MSDFEIDDRAFQKFVEHVGSEVKTRRLLTETSDKLNDISTFAFNTIVKTTPVKTGTLRRAWSKSGVTYTSRQLSVKISNDQDYASFVENGHRTRSGSWVNGRFMNKNALDDANDKINNDLKGFFDKNLRELMGD
ncbi:HK97 gp10 family phage protein [Apilactobacillus sp. EABW-1NA]|uniref:HK97 gp10 family phage protein n=1 Tax=Apilactobacillus sp. EABW-1NA TaxID=2984137 RepID=UPI0025B27CD2|nr:HK97 gp10 family phage protein [Apilactobacillus sp. EABW-1NA]MDN2613003.1 HK97 gp10 family phage protein [Apilactobacillus sp. EABW-1NA]